VSFHEEEEIVHKGGGLLPPKKHPIHNGKEKYTTTLSTETDSLH
jgi:hypothetical protein